VRPHLDAVRVRLLDAGSVMYARGDAHCGLRTSRLKVNYHDCLHYCWPGPWRDVNHIWLRSLVLEADEGGGGGEECAA